MATTTISFSIDDDIKQNAQSILNEMGLDLTTVINSFLKSLVQERRLPFKMRMEHSFRNDACTDYINSELDKSMQEATDPGTKWLTHDEVVDRMEYRRKVRTS